MINIITRYQCDVCKHEYNFKEVAEYCSSYAISLPKFQVGDDVFCYERYEAPEKDKIINMKLSDTYMAQICEGWFERDGNLKNFLEKNDMMDGVSHMHRWMYQVEKSHQMSKDQDSYTDWLDEDSMWHTMEEYQKVKDRI